jgi:hypothetical protein
MRTFLVSCVVAAAIAVGAVYVLNYFQKNAEVAYTTTGVRL